MRHVEEQKIMEFCLLGKESQGRRENIQKSMKWVHKKEAVTGDSKRGN